MRRLFIMRKDLNMSPGKLAAQVGHCAEAYWTRMIKENSIGLTVSGNEQIVLVIPKDIYDDYICGTFTKIICEAKNKNDLMKAVKLAEQYELRRNIDYGLIYDNCLTELQPEEENGTTLTGIWFRPLKDEFAQLISKDYQLYGRNNFEAET